MDYSKKRDIIKERLKDMDEYSYFLRRYKSYISRHGYDKYDEEAHGLEMDIVEQAADMKLPYQSVLDDIRSIQMAGKNSEGRYKYDKVVTEVEPLQIRAKKSTKVKTKRNPRPCKRK